jgi:hypothetical protein
MTHFSSLIGISVFGACHTILQVDKDSLAKMFSPALPEDLLNRIFACFQRDASGNIEIRYTNSPYSYIVMDDSESLMTWVCDVVVTLSRVYHHVVVVVTKSACDVRLLRFPSSPLTT